METQAFGLDVLQARRAFDRAARKGASAAVLEREVERRMLERLHYIRLLPQRVLDAGCGAGRALGLLRARYPRAHLLGVDFAQAMIRAASRSESFAERARRLLFGALRSHLRADFARLPLCSGSIEMVWSNLALAWAQDLPAALRELHRVLAPGGLLMFSGYGPDTLKELKSAFSAASRARHVHSFLDMHEVGDLLLECGFAEPVMDVEMITLTYADVASLTRDLQDSGQTCAARDRARSLTGRSQWRRMLDAYERERTQGRLPATIEIVYGHAWKGEPRVAHDGRHIVKWAKTIAS